MKTIRKSNFFTPIMMSCFIILGAIFQSCEKEEFTLYHNSEYLKIDNLNKEKYSNEEKNILLKAERRIAENLKVTEGKISLSHTSANELNMDEYLFDLFNYIIINSENIPQKFTNNTIRLKSGNTENSNSGRGFIGDLIYNNCGSQIEKDCFDNYWNGNGDMELSEDTWSGVSSYAESSVGSSYKSGTPTVINGNTYYAITVDFYKNTEYNCAFGHATVYFDNSGNAVGFYDEYDFDSKNWGERSVIAEIGTRVIGALGEAHGAQDYTITYGIH